MGSKARLWVINPGDNVATVIGSDIGAPGEVEIVGGATGTIRVTQQVPYGHKVALVDLPAGAEVTKYGAVIGSVAAAAAAGQHVHTHNLQSRRGRGDLETTARNN